MNVEAIVGAWTGERDAIAALLDLVHVCTVGPEATYVDCIARERLITVGEEVGPDSQSACAVALLGQSAWDVVGRDHL